MGGESIWEAVGASLLQVRAPGGLTRMGRSKLLPGTAQCWETSRNLGGLAEGCDSDVSLLEQDKATTRPLIYLKYVLIGHPLFDRDCVLGAGIRAVKGIAMVLTSWRL